MIIFGVVIQKSTNDKKEYYETTSGRVIYLTEKRDEDGTVYYPTYGYTVDGIDYECQSGVGSSSAPSIGTIGTVWYDPEYPDESFTGEEESGGIFAVIIGIAFTLVALAMLAVVTARTVRFSNFLVGFCVGSFFITFAVYFCVFSRDTVGFGVRAFLALLGIVGVFLVYAGIHDLIRPDKPLIHTAAGAANTVPESQRVQEARDIPSRVQGDAWQQQPEYVEYKEPLPQNGFDEFMEDHREDIGRVTNAISKGQVTLGHIIGIGAGAVFIISGISKMWPMILKIVAGGPVIAYGTMIVFYLAFVITGVTVIVKCVKSIGGNKK